ncbi:PAS domain S-box-containing protein [Belnapia rosea]|uniref:PAS domain S-box protein n=1 Tax=Belnapia rosea TaxID=938405 RepID=UPI00088877C0|nr:PAS domain S-box protein [Belnapia rosea]SDB73835.1 PAS domain S-box-containing protein [Belnapia rosea]
MLAEFGEFALRSESLDEILTEACRLVSEALGTKHAKVLEIQHDGQSLLLRAGVGWDPGIVGKLRLEMRERSSETYSIKAGKPTITRDIREEDRFEVPPFLKDAGVVALANVPVLLPGGRPYGLLQVDSREPRDFGEEDTEFLRTYAIILGPVIDRLHKVRSLQATQERFRLVVENALDYAILVTDADDRITDWFPGAEAVFGWTAEEAVGQAASILFTPEDRASHEDDHDAETARAEGVAPHRRWHLRKDRTRVFIDGTVTALRGERGEVRGFLKIGQDITERRTTEEQLRASEERLRALVNATSEVIYTMCADWTEMRQLDGRGFLSDTGSPNRGWLDKYIHPNDQPRVWEAVQEAIRTKNIFELEHRVWRRDGSLGWTLSRAVPLLDARGEIRAWFGVASDVTARKRAEEALRESEARFRHMADSAPALIWMTDADGQITFANMHYDHMFGRPAAEMLGRGWEEIVLPEDLDRHYAAFLEAFHARTPFKTETRVRDRTGQVRWLRCEGVPRMDDGGRFLGYTGCNVDITEARLTAGELERRVVERTAALMTAEETLRQAQKMEAVGQLTGGIAHDFNNMLQGVVGGLEMARRRLAESRAGEVERYLTAAREAAERAAGLTRRLLAFARRQHLDPKPVDPNGLVVGLADLIRRTVGPGVGVELGLRDGAGGVLCDANELESALLNLCINARDAMPEGGQLVIGTEDVRLFVTDLPDKDARPGRYVTISVTDTGTGMPAEVLERVFEPFFTTKPQGQGTGLGLSQVYGFVRQSGGLVRIESTVGQGTTVRLFLPLHEHIGTAEQPEAMPPPRRTGSGKTVLLVDDEEAARRPMADRLSELGYEMLEARDGAEALGILASIKPDLLVTDVGLPNGMNGQQLAEAARERVSGLPILFITGYAGTALLSGVEVLGKPFDLDTLAWRVQAILEKGRSNSDSPPLPSRSQLGP